MPRLLYRLASRAIPSGARIMRAQFTRLYLIAEAGSFVFTGMAVTLQKLRAIAAGTGAFVLIGQAVSLLRSLRLPADAGSFALTGQDVQRGYKIDAGAGSLAFTGNDVVLLASRRVSAGAGAFTLTGQAVTLTYSSSGFNPIIWGYIVADLGAAQPTKSRGGRAAGIRVVFGD